MPQFDRHSMQKRQENPGQDYWINWMVFPGYFPDSNPVHPVILSNSGFLFSCN